MRRIWATGAALALCMVAACGGETDQDRGRERVTMGFSQVGTESAWRLANTKSIKDAAAAAGIDLDFRDGQQQQEKQIIAIRDFIKRRVDVIVFSPVVESGWDTVLQEAKDAGIPVILIDRAVDTTDTSFYATLLGSDFVAEGRKAGEWLVDQYRDSPGPVKIVEIEGTTGSAPANQRREGFGRAIASDPDLEIIASKDGGFTRDRGRQVMASFLKTYRDIDVVYAHNDEEGLGAASAIEAAGKKPGSDMKIITVDASRDGLQALAAGKINYIVECNPLLGSQLMDLVQQLLAGQRIPRRVVVTETTFDIESAKAALPNRQY